MIAILSQQIIGSALKCFGCFFDYGVDFVLRGDCKPVQYLALERASRRFSSRPRPVDSSHVSFIVSAICVFLAIDDYSGMEQGCADCPEDRGKPTRLNSILADSLELAQLCTNNQKREWSYRKQIIYIDDNLGLL